MGYLFLPQNRPQLWNDLALQTKLLNHFGGGLVRLTSIIFLALLKEVTTRFLHSLQIEFMVACMQFINIVVHSVDDMNYRVALQWEFASLGLEEYLEKLRPNESEELSVQISGKNWASIDRAIRRRWKRLKGWFTLGYESAATCDSQLLQKIKKISNFLVAMRHCATAILQWLVWTGLKLCH